jgi:uncharacterized protein
MFGWFTSRTLIVICFPLTSFVIRVVLFILNTFLELYEAAFDLSYLQKAKQLATQMIDLFLDEQNGSFYFHRKDQEKLLVRQKEVYDGALPSGNSVAALQLLRLARLSGDFKLEEIVQGIFQAFSVDVRRYPVDHAYMLQAFLTTQIKMKEIVLIVEHSEQQAFLSHLQQEFYPEVTYLRSDDQLTEFASYTATYHQEGMYICENFVCHQPVLTAEEAIQLLAR